MTFRADFVVVHSALRNTTTVHAAICRRVSTRRQCEVHQRFPNTELADVARWLGDEDYQNGDSRKITVCGCAKNK